MVHEWADLTTTQVAQLDVDRAVAVLLMGATEQHGPHLPLSTDTDIAEGLFSAAIDHVPEWLSIVRLPTLPITASTEHSNFPGTLSVSAEALIDTIRSIGASIAEAGLRRLIILNGHGGNNAAMDMAALDLRRSHGLLVVKLHYPRLDIDIDDVPPEERIHGIHGGAMETAIMLHLQPQRVHMEQFPRPEAPASGMTSPANRGRVSPTGEAPIAWLAEDLDPSGIAGDPRQADAHLGARLVQAYATAIAEVFTETAQRTPPASDSGGTPTSTHA